MAHLEEKWQPLVTIPVIVVLSASVSGLAMLDAYGSLRDVSWWGAFFNTIMAVAAFVAAALFIMWRRGVKEALAKRAERFHALVEASPMAMLISRETDGLILYANEPMGRMFGLSAKELVGCKGLDFYADPADRQVMLSRLRQSGTLSDYEIKAKRADGTLFWLQVSIQRMQYDGKPELLCSFHDISAHKEAEAARKLMLETQALYRKVVEHSSDAIAILDLQGRYQEQNAAHLSLMGHTSEEIIGKTPALHLGERAFATIMQQLAQTGIANGTFSGRTKDGAQRDIDLSVYVVRNEAGEAMCYVEIERDLTERKQIEQQLRQAEKLAAMGTLIAGVAHELNNPLFALSGQVELTTMKVQEGHYEGLSEDLAVISEGVERAVAIVHRFLEAVRSAPVHREPCSVNEILEAALALMVNDWLIHKVSVAKHFPPDRPLVHADAQELMQVFLNLFTNARQAIASANGRGIIRVTTTFVKNAANGWGGGRVSAAPSSPTGSASGEQDGWVEVCVQDDGPGIAPEHLMRIFEPFFTTKPVGEGTGLGLSLCHRIVKEHGGTLTCQSVQGQGATFVIRLPAAGQ